MGYHMTQLSCYNFLLKAENQKEALQAIRRLADHKDKHNPGEPRRFAWVKPDFAKKKSLGKALACWRWETEEDDDTNIIRLVFTGENLGDEDILFSTLAPFVQFGTIEMLGEDSEAWRWIFRDGKLFAQDGELVFSEERRCILCI